MTAFCVSRFQGKRSVSSFLSCLGASALFLTVSAPRAQAAFVAGAGVDTPLFFIQHYTWTWPAAGAEAALAHKRRNWGRILEGTPGVAAGSRDLTVKVRHETAPHAGEPAPNAFITLSLPGLVRPAGMGEAFDTDAAQVGHGTHWDTAAVIVNVHGVAVPGPTAHITTLGSHNQRKSCIAEFRQSTTNNETLAVTLQPQYRDTNGNIVPGQMRGPFSLARELAMIEPLPIELVSMSLTGYTLNAQGSGQTSTTLGFTGKVNDLLSQLDLGIGTQLFGARADTPIPFFYQSGQALYIAVNLTKYLGMSPQLQPGQQYVFQNGVCSQLPGVLASLSPVQFQPGIGYRTGEPYSGPLVVQGMMRATQTHALRGRVHLEDVSDAAVPLTMEMRPTEGDAMAETVIPAADGTFELRGYPEGSYSLWAKGEKWLADSVLVNVMPNTLPEVSLELMGGDANDDNSADVLDLDALIQAFDTADGDPLWNEFTDFNSDGSTDVLDLDILLRNFDITGEL